MPGYFLCVWLYSKKFMHNHLFNFHNYSIKFLLLLLSYSRGNIDMD